MSQIMELADSPPVTVGPQTTVLEAVEEMERKRVGAVAVVSENKLSGIFTERDVMLRVVAKRLDPAQTPVSKVMTADVLTIDSEITPEEALEIMLERHIRHLPVQGTGGTLVGMLSIRNLLQNQVERLSTE